MIFENKYFKRKSPQIEDFFAFFEEIEGAILHFLLFILGVFYCKIYTQSKKCDIIGLAIGIYRELTIC